MRNKIKSIIFAVKLIFTILKKPKKIMNAIESLIINWLNTNTDKSKAKEIIESVLRYLQTVAANIENIVAGTDIIPAIGVSLPAWAQTIETGLKALFTFDPTLLKGAITTLISTVTTILTDLTNELNAAPAPAPANLQTPSYVALKAKLGDISTTANAAKGAAPSVAGNLSAIETMVKDAVALVDEVVKEVKGII